MTEEDDAKLAEEDDEAIRALMKRAMDTGANIAPPPDLLRGVQKKIRTRSKGKFYGDGWSTTQTRVHYAVIAFVMLLVIAVAYVALGPMGFSR